MGLLAPQRRLVDGIRDALASSLDLHEVLTLAHPLLQQVVPADAMALGITLPGSPSAFDWIVTAMPPAFFRDYPAMAKDDFVLKSVLASPNRVLRDSDMLTRRALETNSMYGRARELGMPLEQVMSAMLHVDGQWASGISLYREKRRPFSDGDRDVLQSLVPALRNTVRNCRAFGERSGRADALLRVLADQGLATLLVRPPGSELARTDACTQLLERWFSAHEQQRGIPHALLDWLEQLTRSNQLEDAAPCVLKRSEQAELRAQAYWVPQPWGGYAAVLLREERASPALPAVWARRLTPRELEVVQEVVQGFDNRTIAETLHIELSTLKKHIGSAFVKLGFESRSQLIAHARRATP